MTARSLSLVLCRSKAHSWQRSRRMCSSSAGSCRSRRQSCSSATSSCRRCGSLCDSWRCTTQDGHLSSALLAAAGMPPVPARDLNAGITCPGSCFEPEPSATCHGVHRCCALLEDVHRQRVQEKAQQRMQVVVQAEEANSQTAHELSLRQENLQGEGEQLARRQHDVAAAEAAVNQQLQLVNHRENDLQAQLQVLQCLAHTHNMERQGNVGCAEVRIKCAACLAVHSRPRRIAGSLLLLQALAFTSTHSLGLYLILWIWHLTGSVVCRRCTIRSRWSRSRLRQPGLQRLLFWKSGTRWLGCARLHMLSTSKPSSSGGRQAQLSLEVCCLLSSVHALGDGAAGFPAVWQRFGL